MKFLIVTCNHTNHIVNAQKWLLKKYAPQLDIEYINLGNEPIETWTNNVLKKITTDQDYVMFGLDDYLPIAELNEKALKQALKLMKSDNLDRIELGWGASKKQGFIDKRNYLLYSRVTPYSVSCQISIWNTEVLRKTLKKERSPWQFEVECKLKNAACFTFPVWRWIEESALSNRQKGKVNVLGLKPSDVKELVSLGYLDESKLIYGWKGAAEYSKELGGNKYNFNYD